MILDDVGWMLMDRGWTFRDAEACLVSTRWYASWGMHWHVALREGITVIRGHCHHGKPHEDLVALVRRDMEDQRRRRPVLGVAP